MLEYRFGAYGVQCKGGSNFVDPSFGADFALVGSNSKQTNEFCNVFGRNMGCLDGWRHKGLPVPEKFLGKTFLDGKIGEDQAVIHVSATHCSDPLCPVCCFAWAKKTAKRAMGRFEVFDLVYGHLYEKRHVTVSVPKFDYDKSLKFIRRQAANFAEFVGLIGFSSIYHPKRVNHYTKRWYYSPHFHFVGYVKDGYVDGNMVKVVHNLSGYVLRNLEARKSIIGTFLYQLSHAGVSKGVHTVTWHGELNYRKTVNDDLKQLVIANERNARAEAKKCPVCGSKLRHVCRSASAPVFSYDVFEDRFVLDDCVNWVVVPDVYHQRKRKFSVDEDTKWDEYKTSDG